MISNTTIKWPPFMSIDNVLDLFIHIEMIQALPTHKRTDRDQEREDQFIKKTYTELSHFENMHSSELQLF